jgi:apolipoprotein N-acyltransferase
MPSTDATPTPIKPRAWRWPLLAGLAHSILMWLAFAPVGWWVCVLVAPVPIFLAALCRDMSPIKAALWCALGVLPFWVLTEWWILDVSAAGWPFLVLIQTSWTVLLVWSLARLRNRLPRLPLALAAPFAWTAVEYLRGEVFGGGYAWSLIAYPLIDAPLFAAAGAAVGVYGVGLLTACVGAAIAARFMCEGRWRVIAPGVLLAVWIVGTLGGRLAFTEPAAARDRTPVVAIVQTNVPQNNKVHWTILRELADWKRFEELTREAAKRTPDLIIWPETMMPGPTLEPEALETLAAGGIFYNADFGDGEIERVPAGAFARRMMDVQKELGVPMLVGEEAMIGLKLHFEDDGVRLETQRRHNSVYLVSVGKVQSVRYDKMHLTPFGETMPYISAWPWLQQQLLDLGARGMRFDLQAGITPTVLAVPLAGGGTLNAVAPICFEITNTRLLRSMVYGPGGARRAGAIVNVTNDGWFGDADSSRRQHLQIARWRALETGTPILRAANTGISGVIDGAGRLLHAGVQSGESRIDGYLVADIPPHAARPTPYAFIGLWPPIAALAGMILLSLLPRRSPARPLASTPAP